MGNLKKEFPYYANFQDPQRSPSFIILSDKVNIKKKTHLYKLNLGKNNCSSFWNKCKVVCLSHEFKLWGNQSFLVVYNKLEKHLSISKSQDRLILQLTAKEYSKIDLTSSPKIVIIQGKRVCIIGLINEQVFPCYKKIIYCKHRQRHNYGYGYRYTAASLKQQQKTINWEIYVLNKRHYIYKIRKEPNDNIHLM